MLTIARNAVLTLFMAAALMLKPDVGFGRAAAMDWLTPHLENQRHKNLRRYQQRQTTKRRSASRQDRQDLASPAVRATRMAEQRRQVEPEYNRRVKRDGRASANRWLKKKAFELGVAEGRRARQALRN